MFRRFFAGLADRKWCKNPAPKNRHPATRRIAASNGSIANFRAKQYSTFARWLNGSLAANAQISIYCITPSPTPSASNAATVSATRRWTSAASDGGGPRRDGFRGTFVTGMNRPFDIERADRGARPAGPPLRRQRHRQHRINIVSKRSNFNRNSGRTDFRID